MVDGDKDEHDELADDLAMLKLDVKRALIQVRHERVTNGRQGLVGLLGDSANVRAKDALLDLLDLEADLLTVRRVEQKVRHRLPLLQRQSVPLLARRSEGIYEAAEDVDAIGVAICRFTDKANGIKRANTDLPENFVNLLKSLRLAHDGCSDSTDALAFESELGRRHVSLSERSQIVVAALAQSRCVGSH